MLLPMHPVPLRPNCFHAVSLLMTVLAGMVAFSAEAADKVEFNRDIRPILSDRCFRCHGPDKGARKADLRLDLPEQAFAEHGKKHVHPIVPGSSAKSAVYQRITTTDKDDLMPPPESNLTLTPHEKELLKKWIDQGARYDAHWAFVPLPDKISLPKVKNKKWVHNGLDAFILAKLEKEAVKPSPQADKLRWLRRVTYDLTGLPPTPEEVDDFSKDSSAIAYTKVVDRLLASPRYGERMAVPWLDAARYADSYGYQSDQMSPTWPYRDWVVRAFNRNLPYDQFLTDQLAGDLEKDASRETRLATAFNRLHRQTNEGGSIAEEWRLEYVADRVHTFGTTFLALTMECCRCHDHKYDPLAQRDYYSLSSFFNNIDEYGLYNDSARVPTPSLLLPNPEQETALNTTASNLVAATKKLTNSASSTATSFRAWLAASPQAVEVPNLVAQYTFDELATNRFANVLSTNSWSTGLGGSKLAEGRHGKALEFNGDDEITFPGALGSVEPWDAYTVNFALKRPASLTNAVIFHRSAGTDVGFFGTELTLDEGHLFFVIKRFWPGNAVAVRSKEMLPADDWAEIGVTYDGSGRAAGMKLYWDGRPLTLEVVRDQLQKSPQNGGDGLSFGARFRSTGLKNSSLDDLRIYNRALSPVEMAQLHDGKSLAEALAKKDEEALLPYFTSTQTGAWSEAQNGVSQALKGYLEARNGVQETSVMEEMEAPRPAYLLARGRYDAPTNETTRVQRSTPASLPKFPETAPRDRLGLAQWLTDPKHPLTARVAVNRLWQQLFGKGLVTTTENFGLQGSQPSHPELLDWLARELINSGWDIKATLKQWVLSATYRQDSAVRPDLQEKDPENKLWARGPSHRLPGEMIRDTALAASGLLKPDLGGPPVSPYQPGDLWRESNTMSPAYHQSVGEDLYRRSLYTVWKRTAPMPNMSSFDAPSREVCVVKRSTTSTPQQAFVLLNDVQFVEAARVLAEKALGQPEGERIAFVFQRLTARQPEAAELKVLREIWSEQHAIFTKEPQRADQLISVGDRKRDPSLNPIELATATSVTQAILNLDATVWKR